MSNEPPAPTRFPPYVLMVLVALAVRLAVIPFLYHDWMDPFVLEHWAFGRIARSIASGHGFGSPFADTGLSALLPPTCTLPIFSPAFSKSSASRRGPRCSGLYR